MISRAKKDKLRGLYLPRYVHCVYTARYNDFKVDLFEGNLNWCSHALVMVLASSLKKGLTEEVGPSLELCTQTLLKSRDTQSHLAVL